MVTDYELAWVRLQELIASKPQHGREPTLVAMAQLAAECRVPAGELTRLLRLYGVEVERARLIAAETGPSAVTDSSGESLPGGTDRRGASSTVGGHDGSRDGQPAGVC